MYQVYTFKQADDGYRYTGGQIVGPTKTLFQSLKDRTNTFMINRWINQSKTTRELAEVFKAQEQRPEITYAFADPDSLKENSHHSSIPQPTLLDQSVSQANSLPLPTHSLPPQPANSDKQAMEKKDSPVITQPSLEAGTLLSSMSMPQSLPLDKSELMAGKDRTPVVDHDLDELEFELTMPGTKTRSDALNSYPAAKPVDKRMPAPIIPFFEIEGPDYVTPKTEGLASRIKGLGNQEQPSKGEEVAKRTFWGIISGTITVLWYAAIVALAESTFVGWIATAIAVVGFAIGYFKGPEVNDNVFSTTSDSSDEEQPQPQSSSDPSAPITALNSPIAIQFNGKLNDEVMQHHRIKEEGKKCEQTYLQYMQDRYHKPSRAPISSVQIPTQILTPIAPTSTTPTLSAHSSTVEEDLDQLWSSSSDSNSSGSGHSIASDEEPSRLKKMLGKMSKTFKRTTEFSSNATTHMEKDAGTIAEETARKGARNRIGNESIVSEKDFYADMDQ